MQGLIFLHVQSIFSQFLNFFCFPAQCICIIAAITPPPLTQMGCTSCRGAAKEAEQQFPAGGQNPPGPDLLVGTEAL